MLTLTRISETRAVIREYATGKALPAGSPCDYRPQVCTHGAFEYSKALDWLASR